MCEWASKQSPDFKNYTTPGQRPGSRIPGSVTAESRKEKKKILKKNN